MLISKPLNTKIKQWFYQRNMQSLEPLGQAAYAMTEYKEYCEAVVSLDKDELKDAIGDIYVCLMGVKITAGIESVVDVPEEETIEQGVDYHLAVVFEEILKNRDIVGAVDSCINSLNWYAQAHLNISLEECVEYAYEEIKDRKGLVINGVFVKYESLSEDDQAVCDLSQGDMNDIFDELEIDKL